MRPKRGFLGAALLLIVLSSMTGCLQKYTLSINVQGTGSVTPAGGGKYDAGTTVTLTAVATDPHWVFERWTGGVQGTNNPTSVVMNSDKNVTAVFRSMRHALNITIEGEGSVAETLVTARGASYDEGDVVSLQAVPEEGWAFDRWGNGLTGSINPTTITMNAEKNVTAVFVPVETGSIAGIVRDALTHTAIDGVTVTVYDDTTEIATGATDSSGCYSVEATAGSDYRVEFSKTGYLPAVYYGVEIIADTTTTLEPVLQIDNGHSGTGNVSGHILHALTGQGVSELNISLRAGINVVAGTPTATTTTGAGGAYSITSLPAGNYTAEVSGAGYITMHFNLVCLGGITTADQDAAITPLLPSGETRIILRWGATPSDLDSHLTGPKDPSDTSNNSWEESGRFHIYYARQTYSYSGTQYADLDLDDTTGYGPETTTIRQQLTGTYRYSIHDYTNGNSTSSYALSNSSAQVKVYQGSDLVAVFNVPANQEGTLWTVFEMNGDTITPINTMTYAANTSTIRGLEHDATDAGLIGRLRGSK